jgi:hypothetical protein
MSEEIIQQPTTTEPATESPIEKRRRVDRESKRIRRAEARAIASENQSYESKKKDIDALWARNYAKLSQKAKKELNNLIEDFEYIETAICGSASRMSTEAYGSSGGDIELLPEQWLAEVERFAAEHPPTDIPYGEYDYQDLASQPRYFAQYGLRVDNLDNTIYLSFLRNFSDWYRRSRHSVVLRTGDQWCRTWEQVDALIAANPRLSGIKAIPPTPEILLTPPAAPSTIAETIKRTLADMKQADVGGEEI